MTPVRFAIAAAAVVVLAGCGPDKPASTGQQVAASPSASESPSPSPSPSESPSPVVSSDAVVVPGGSVKPPVKVPTTKAAPKTTAPAGGGGGSVVTPGAFCSPVGATGVTKAGTRMRCTLKAGEDRARWRAA
jgi:hypothetical protein